jgi:hypothetical protein
MVPVRTNITPLLPLRGLHFGRNLAHHKRPGTLSCLLEHLHLRTLQEDGRIFVLLSRAFRLASTLFEGDKSTACFALANRQRLRSVIQ